MAMRVRPPGCSMKPPVHTRDRASALYDPRMPPADCRGMVTQSGQRADQQRQGQAPRSLQPVVMMR